MANLKALTILLCIILASAKSLPLDNRQSSEDSLDNISSDNARGSAEKSQDSTNANDESNEVIPAEDSIHDDVEEDEENENHLVEKRSPYIPDPDLVKGKSSESNSGSDEHATHDEYLEWRRKVQRQRREVDEDEAPQEDENDDNDDDEKDEAQTEQQEASDEDNKNEENNVNNNNVDGDDDNDDVEQQATNQDEIIINLIDDSLEGYAKGCEVVEENEAEDINETTYNEDKRRKREVSNESEEKLNEEEAQNEEENEETQNDEEANSIDEQNHQVVKSAEENGSLSDEENRKVAKSAEEVENENQGSMQEEPSSSAEETL